MSYGRLKRGGRPGGSSLSITFCVERGEDELELDIDGNVTSYDPGRLSGPPEDCYPPEGGEAEIESVTLDGKRWDGTLTKEELDAVEEQLREAAQDAYDAAMEDAAEAAAEARAEARYDDYDY